MNYTLLIVVSAIFFCFSCFGEKTPALDANSSRWLIGLLESRDDQSFLYLVKGTAFSEEETYYEWIVLEYLENETLTGFSEKDFIDSKGKVKKEWKIKFEDITDWMVTDLHFHVQYGKDDIEELMKPESLENKDANQAAHTTPAIAPRWPIIRVWLQRSTKILNSQIIVIVGPTSSGKTELAKALQESLLPQVWLHYSVDSLIYALPGSVLARCNNNDDWSGVDGSLLFRSAVSCLKTLASEGNSVIFDMVLPNEKRAKELLMALSGMNAYKVKLTCSWKEIRKRTINRGDRTLSEAERSFKARFPGFQADASFDTTQTTSTEIAELILSSMKNKEGESDGPHNSGQRSAPTSA